MTLGTAQVVDIPNSQYRIILDPVYGYRRLDPIPTDAELTTFYRDRYYDLIREGGRAPELKRFMEGGDNAAQERAWLRATVYADIAHVLNANAPGHRVLDVGCGTGEALLALRDEGFETYGLEPAVEAAAAAQAHGLVVHAEELAVFSAAQAHGLGPFAAVTLLNVLEHVAHPAEVLRAARELLAPSGIVAVRVPNDFNEFQRYAQRMLGRPPWWITVPDHINYFGFEALHRLLDMVGFEIVHSQGDFPMELFLLMGDNYLDNPDLGAVCHAKRVRFELSVDSEYRRSLYQALAPIGASRDCLVFGRRTAE